jgi:hypothetical protein
VTIRIDHFPVAHTASFFIARNLGSFSPRRHEGREEFGKRILNLHALRVLRGETYRLFFIVNKGVCPTPLQFRPLLCALYAMQVRSLEFILSAA